MYACNDVYDPWLAFRNHLHALKHIIEDMSEENRADALRTIRRDLFNEDNLTEEEKLLKKQLERALARLS